MPTILFVHENYPAQFGAIADHLAAKGWRVVCATQNQNVPKDKPIVTKAGVRVVRYARSRDAKASTHRYLHGTESAVLNGQGFARLAVALNNNGFVPDVVVAHSGWGSGSFAKVIWPDTKLIQYLEWWYNYPIIDAGPEDEAEAEKADKHARALVRNLPFFLDFQQADLVLAPTQFQADQFPDFVRAKTVVQHDGVDCALFRPLETGEDKYAIDGVPNSAQIVTFTTRGMEPMRGFPTFMAAMAQVLQQRPHVHVVIAGNDRVHYGKKPEGFETWKEKALAEHDFPEDRLHFVGLMPKPDYARLLRRSDAHVYLTRPFVLSWSLIESMASNAPIICSDVDPVREAIGAYAVQYVTNEDPMAVSNAVNWCLDHPNEASTKGQAAGAHARQKYCTTHCYGELEKLYLSVANG